VVTVQRTIRAKYAKDPPTDKTIRAWYKQFTETGCLCKQKSSGRPLTAEDDIERFGPVLCTVRRNQRGLQLRSYRCPKQQWRVLRERLVFKLGHIQMAQQLSDEEHSRRLDLCLQLPDCMSSDDHFVEKVQFSDEATFQVSGAVNRRNVRIWGSEKSYAYVEHQRTLPTVW